MYSHSINHNKNIHESRSIIKSHHGRQVASKCGKNPNKKRLRNHAVKLQEHKPEVNNTTS